jgi:hypothetical protein
MYWTSFVSRVIVLALNYANLKLCEAACLLTIYHTREYHFDIKLVLTSKGRRFKQDRRPLQTSPSIDRDPPGHAVQ